jgi:hypothetical protein
VQTGVPDETEPEPVAAGEAADDAALVAEAPALAAPADDVVEAAAGEDEDDAAHPAARTPAASNGTATSAFFTRSPEIKERSMRT